VVFGAIRPAREGGRLTRPARHSQRFAKDVMVAKVPQCRREVVKTVRRAG